MRKKEYEALKRTVGEVEHVVDRADYLKHAYFWSGDNGNASARRSREKYLSAHAEWKEGGHEWYADIEVSQSRQNTYVYTHYYKDDDRTNLKAVRYSLKRMQATLAEETAKREKREARKQARLARLAETAQAVTEAVTGTEMPEAVTA